MLVWKKKCLSCSTIYLASYMTIHKFQLQSYSNKYLLMYNKFANSTNWHEKLTKLNVVFTGS